MRLTSKKGAKSFGLTTKIKIEDEDVDKKA